MMSMAGALRRLGLSALAAATVLSSLTSANLEVRSLEERAASGNRLVFCHFMIGIVGDRTSAADYDADMQRAKAAGIDAFALNIGVDSYTDQQLGYAYQSAANNGMKVFISFDFNWWSPSDSASVGRKIAQYANQPAQLQVNGRVFASSFAGDGLDGNVVRSAAGLNAFLVPNVHPGQSSPDSFDGAFNWAAWDSNGNNKAPTPGANVTVAQGDSAYQSWLGGKTYLAPISPWFSTHYGPEVSYSKNFVFPGGSLLFDRWKQVIQQGFPMVEIITWNDYGESHYIGPLSSKHGDDGNSKWTNDMTHNGWLDLSKPFIAAYKNADSNVANYIQNEQIVYWYRRNLKTLNCDATDTTSNHPANNASGNYFEGIPNGWQDMDDAVYAVALLKSAGTLTVTSGGNTKTFNAPAGANIFTVPAGLGKQTFSLTRNGQTVLSGTSLMDITNVCACGIYNFNAYVGTVPAGPSDSLSGDALTSLTTGLHVSTCLPQPSLGTNPPVPVSTPATPTSSSPPSSPSNCVAGTVAPGESGNFAGLCSFSCK
ncbi:glycoside hydrolase family 71 [Trichoderma arundinaceum]|uniref:Glycoside hydrolase family 71 n=1 Tax=Trichoderma arundinaceum TaxID=490622 RepID=A0A395NEW2_TRIAR|nr:glycoside hydrolase family 71 [Trichoderma arundinaceum]